MARRNTTDEYSLFRNNVSSDERSALATSLDRFSPDSFEAIAQQGHVVLKALVSGQLPPSIAQEARGLLEMQMMAVAAVTKRDAPAAAAPEGLSVTLNLLNALDEQEPLALEAQYTAVTATPEPDDTEDLT